MPRLGALIATERSAVVNEEWGMVHPSVREICFNAAIVNNDGLLATSIARREQIPYEAACLKMEQGIKELKRQLDTGSEVSLGRIGTLSRSADGRMRFIPSLKAEQHAASLGLSTIDLSDVSGNKETDTETHNQRYYNLRISKFAIRVAASVAIPVMAAMSILLWTMSVTDVTPSSQRLDYASVIPVPHDAESAVPGGEESDEPQGKIVVAVFNTRHHAALFMQQHAPSPYELSVENYGTSWRVTAGGIHSRRYLVGLLHTTDFIVEFPGAWIWMQD